MGRLNWSKIFKKKDPIKGLYKIINQVFPCFHWEIIFSYTHINNSAVNFLLLNVNVYLVQLSHMTVYETQNDRSNVLIIFIL